VSLLPAVCLPSTSNAAIFPKTGKAGVKLAMPPIF
jgi:hypothetical protein